MQDHLQKKHSDKKGVPITFFSSFRYQFWVERKPIYSSNPSLEYIATKAVSHTA